MKILITNDDGFDAPGLQCLYRRLSTEHEVWIVAPKSNKSGASSSLTMYCPLELEKRWENAWTLDGTPVDCVISALKGNYLPSRPDIVLSGINNEGNLGTDVVYSGTCAGARQASLYGIPGIALSVEKIPGTGINGTEKAFLFEPMADFVAKNLKNLIHLCGNVRNIREGEGYSYYVSVNAPSLVPYAGIRYASLCSRIYGDKVTLEHSPDGRLLSVCAGGAQMQSLGSEDSDYNLVQSGFVAVSVLRTEPDAAAGVSLSELSLS